MKRDWKYFIYLAIIFGLYVLVRLTSPKQFDWTVTYAHDDRDPYGTFVLSQLMPSIFDGAQVRNSNQTFYELKDTLEVNDNIITISRHFDPGREDVATLLEHVSRGGSAYISAQNFSGLLKDTLGIGTNDFFFQNNYLDRSDSSFVQFSNPSLDTMSRFWFKSDDIHQYFNKFDTTKFTVIARNGLRQPVSLHLSWGRGKMILNCTPMVHTNIYLLARNNQGFVAKSMSYLGRTDIEWTEFYHLGRMETKSPLRFILTNEPLRWAYFVTIFSIVLFMIFESRRKQRIIPIIRPLPNTTLQFVSTIGNLYFEHADHRNIAEKKINFLLEQIRAKYYISTNRFDETFIRQLAHKSGKGEADVRALFNTISYISTVSRINVELLIDLNERIEKFNS